VIIRELDYAFFARDKNAAFGLKRQFEALEAATQLVAKG
jgi:hypothetical protein